MTLSQRVEQAKPEDARGLMEELWRRIGEYEWEDGIVWRQLLDINTPEAHLAAAMMMVPEGWFLASLWQPASQNPVWRAELREGVSWEYGRAVVSRGSATPALAVIAAIVRSIGHGSA